MNAILQAGLDGVSYTYSYPVSHAVSATPLQWVGAIWAAGLMISYMCLMLRPDPATRHQRDVLRREAKIYRKSRYR